MGNRSPWVRSALLLALSVLLLPLIFSARLPAFVPAAATCFWGVVLAARAWHTRHLTGHTPADWPLLALIMLLPLGLWVSADQAVSLLRTYAFIAAAALYWLVAALPRQTTLRLASGGLLLGGLALSALILGATSFQAKIPGLSLDLLGLLHSRLQGILPQADDFNPNTSGSSAVLCGGVVALASLLTSLELALSTVLSVL